MHALFGNAGYPVDLIDENGVRMGQVKLVGHVNEYDEWVIMHGIYWPPDGDDRGEYQPPANGLVEPDISDPFAE